MCVCVSLVGHPPAPALCAWRQTRRLTRCTSGQPHTSLQRPSLLLAYLLLLSHFTMVPPIPPPSSPTSSPSSVNARNEGGRSPSQAAATSSISPLPLSKMSPQLQIGEVPASSHHQQQHPRTPTDLALFVEDLLEQMVRALIGYCAVLSSSYYAQLVSNAYSVCPIVSR